MTQYRRPDIDPLERVQRYKRFYGGLVFDKLWSLDIKETMLSPKIFPLRQDMVLAGHALTIKMHSHAEEEEVIRERGERGWGGGPKQKKVMEAITPGCVICIDTGPNFLAAQWGEMSSNLAQTLGSVGVVIAGNVRDTRIILQMEDFPVFTMGITANAKTGWIVNEINTPIYMPGHLKHSVKVFPGDFIFGDLDGVQVIPREAVDEVMLRCEELLDSEIEERKKIRAGMHLDDVYRIYGNL
ncbi:MAG: RraA family protein [Deltaproteobacteria bacterium]|nr:RraA family protein [Deltaproteobacteria bacterium]MBW2309289.1 RraA family protein [Deltaproteobacteria bacterium]